MNNVLCILLCRTTAFYDNILVAFDDYSGVSYYLRAVPSWKLWSTMIYGSSFWGFVMLTFLVKITRQVFM